jgi:PEP-CTERM motif
MRRLMYLLLLVSFVGISATCVNASTDCERWYIAYRRELAHTRSIQRIAAAKRRAQLYAQRKLVVTPKPKPKAHLVLARGPRMTRKQTLHHFDLACGVLPEDESDTGVISEETPPSFHEHPLNDGIDPIPVGIDDMIAQNDTPPPPTEYSNYSPGGPPMSYPPFTNGPTPAGGGGGSTPPPGTPTPTGPTPPVNPPPVPEPASYVLLLTGFAGAAGAVRRRFNQ